MDQLAQYRLQLREKLMGRKAAQLISEVAPEVKQPAVKTESALDFWSKKGLNENVAQSSPFNYVWGTRINESASTEGRREAENSWKKVTAKHLPENHQPLVKETRTVSSTPSPEGKVVLGKHKVL